MITVDKLKSFEDYPAAEQDRMRGEVDAALAQEREWALSQRPFADPASILAPLDMVRIRPDLGEDHFGVVSPIRGRRPLYYDYDPVGEQSYPYLRNYASAYLSVIAHLVHGRVMEGYEGDAQDIAFAVTSLTRTVKNQQHIVANGRLASQAVGGFYSSHCLGTAFDIDHSGGYVLIDGQWRNANTNENPELWQPVREIARTAFTELLGSMSRAGEINVIDEVPDGRGVFHVAVKPVVR